VTAPHPLDLAPASVDTFLAKTVEDADFAASVAKRAVLTEAATADLLGNLASEARLACRLLDTVGPSRETRVLEVGAGAGVVAAFLHGQGANVVAIEPIVGGFEAFMVVRSELAERVAMPAIEPLAAEQLRPAEHGLFDLIISVNVLEHMQPLGRNLDALATVLASGGTMIHTCPNYRVPYEPHYRIPLVPFHPGLTRYVARRAGQEPLWDSLNWITAGDLRRYANRHGLTLRFREGELAAALRRLRDDPEFARRQRGPITAALRLLDRIGVAGLIARMPATWLTPMTFTVTKPAEGPSDGD
jgi:2-polyprenyl-3-methyl-5-hydroxy-6-metoxy-1,4-benzoquinol methylase